MTTRLKKRVFITGGARGLGYSFASNFLSMGWKVGVFDLDLDAGFNKSTNKNGIDFYCGDVSNFSEIEYALNQFCGDYGLNLLINNAGIASGGSFLERPLEDWNRLYDVNVAGTINSTKAAFGHLKKQCGTVHNVASAAAFMSSPRMAAYNSTKAALVSLSESLKGEFQKSGVSVSVSLPGFFESSLFDKMLSNAQDATIAKKLSSSSGYTSDDIARQIIKGIKSNEFYIFAPKRISYLWFWKRLFPIHFLHRIPILRERRIAKLSTR